jgi:hypothetical protein
MGGIKVNQTITFTQATTSTQVVSPPEAVIQITRVKLSPAGKAALSGALTFVPSSGEDDRSDPPKYAQTSTS